LLHVTLFVLVIFYHTELLTIKRIENDVKVECEMPMKGISIFFYNHAKQIGITIYVYNSIWVPFN